PEDGKAELYGRAWLSLTASSAEGWGLTVMEAAACGTPSAALRVGGLGESIVDGQTGLLADTPEELTAKVRALIADPVRRGEGGRLAATLTAWSRHLAIATLAAGAVGLALRVPLAHLVGVPEHPIAAAAILPTGGLWLLLSLQRGALQGVHAYAPVGISLVVEAFGRLVCGLALVLAGAGVTGAFLGTPLALALTSIGLAVVLRRRLGRPEGREA